MRAEHLEILVEEPSMEAFLRELLPRFLGGRATFEVHPFQGKDDLLEKLPARLRGYANWLPKTARVVVVVDCDDDDCKTLKQKMEKAAADAGLRTRSAATTNEWKVANRIAIEELEAWYFGEWIGVRSAFPKVSKTIPSKAKYRDSDAVRGGTWEAFERILQKAGYFKSGLRKTEIARALGKQFCPDRTTSRSFAAFRDVLLDAIA